MVTLTPRNQACQKDQLNQNKDSESAYPEAGLAGGMVSTSDTTFSSLLRTRHLSRIPSI